MLIISRRKGQRIVIGNDLEVIVTDLSRSTVKLGIRAPAQTIVMRGEVHDSIEEANREAALGQFDEALLGLPAAPTGRPAPPTATAAPLTTGLPQRRPRGPQQVERSDADRRGDDHRDDGHREGPGQRLAERRGVVKRRG